MSEKLEPILVDSVANTNFNNLAEFPTLHFAAMMQDNKVISKQQNENMVRGSSRFNGALDSLMVRGLKDVAELDMGEASAMVKAGTGVDPQSQGYLLGQTLGQLSAAVAAIQQLVKTAQST